MKLRAANFPTQIINKVKEKSLLSSSCSTVQSVQKRICRARRVPPGIFVEPTEQEMLERYFLKDFIQQAG